jgi:E3 ubiquitin-protein ligase MYCBP2
VRQVKVFGHAEAKAPSASHLVMQQKGCEAETLKVFRLLTSQVFGRLITEDAPNEGKQEELGDSCDDVDLKEHMVGILFSRSKLSHLQKQVSWSLFPTICRKFCFQVCVHIVQAIRKETIRVQEEWEDKLQSGDKADMEASKDKNKLVTRLLSRSRCLHLDLILQNVGHILL